MKRKFIQTADGSTSIFLEEMDEHYHSKHGAIAESEHIFVKNGLMAKNDLAQINIFEVGMGTGLNVLTTLKAAGLNHLKVNYHTVEAFPIRMNELDSINFPSLLNISSSIFLKLHESSWSDEIKLSEELSLTKYEIKLQNFEFASNFYDVIYFDAFAPEKQVEMWSKEIFEKLYGSLKEGGILVTYCVKGEIRRRLQSVGFTIEKLKGPEGGKREMCRATK